MNLISDPFGELALAWGIEGNVTAKLFLIFAALAHLARFLCAQG